MQVFRQVGLCSDTRRFDLLQQVLVLEQLRNLVLVNIAQLRQDGGITNVESTCLVVLD